MGRGVRETASCSEGGRSPDLRRDEAFLRITQHYKQEGAALSMHGPSRRPVQRRCSPPASQPEAIIQRGGSGPGRQGRRRAGTTWPLGSCSVIDRLMARKDNRTLSGGPLPLQIQGGVGFEQIRPTKKLFPCPLRCSSSHPPCSACLLGARIKYVVEPIVTTPLRARRTTLERSCDFVLWHAHHLLSKLQTGNRCRYTSFINRPHDE